MSDQNYDRLEYDPNNLTLKCGGELIWDFGNFRKVTFDELFKSTDLLEPKKLDEKYISFCKCTFNIKILIYENATSEDILSSWRRQMTI